MGLDTRAYARATPEWKREWVEKVNAQGYRLVMWGLMAEPIGKVNYGLKGGYLEGRAPFTLEDAPEWHQDGLEDLPWSGGLVGGMISGNGNSPSFRGKVYDEYVEQITGHSLYAACDENWQGEVLLEITEALEDFAENGPANPHVDVLQESVEISERKALATWFRVCVDHDLMVSGDY